MADDLLFLPAFRKPYVGQGLLSEASPTLILIGSIISEPLPPQESVVVRLDVLIDEVSFKT